MKKSVFYVCLAVGAAVSLPSAFALYEESVEQQPAPYYAGHWHGGDGSTHGAPSHTAPVDKWACHEENGQRHCH